MAFSLTEFTANLGKYGTAKSSSFAVLLSPPASLNDSIINDFPLMCDVAAVPGIMFQADENRPMGYGLVEKRPSAISYDDLNITIIGDGRGLVYAFFRKWMALVASMDGSAQSTYGIQQGFFNFPEEYWGTIDLYMYAIDSHQYEHLTFERAFPLGIAPVDLAWGNSDQLVQYQVGFSYRSFTSKNLSSIKSTTTSINNITNSNSRTLEDLENLLTNPKLETYQQRFDKMQRVPTTDQVDRTPSRFSEGASSSGGAWWNFFS